MIGEVVIGPDAYGPIKVMPNGHFIEVTHAGAAFGIRWPAHEAKRLAWMADAADPGMILYNIETDSRYQQKNIQVYKGSTGIKLMQNGMAIHVPERSRTALGRAIRCVGAVTHRRNGIILFGAPV